jgi:hypothetical protein
MFNVSIDRTLLLSESRGREAVHSIAKSIYGLQLLVIVHDRLTVSDLLSSDTCGFRLETIGQCSNCPNSVVVMIIPVAMCIKDLQLSFRTFASCPCFLVVLYILPSNGV